MKKMVLCLILLLSVAPVALAGMEYNPTKNRWEFVPDTDEKMKFKTPEDEWSYRKSNGKTEYNPYDSVNEAQKHYQNRTAEPEQTPAKDPEQTPEKEPEPIPANRPMKVPPPMLPPRR